MKTTPTAPRKEEEIIPSAPVPARTERRVNTTQPQPHPVSYTHLTLPTMLLV